MSSATPTLRAFDTRLAWCCRWPLAALAAGASCALPLRFRLCAWRMAGLVVVRLYVWRRLCMVLDRTITVYICDVVRGVIRRTVSSHANQAAERRVVRVSIRDLTAPLTIRVPYSYTLRDSISTLY